jgi:hypothetical protein
MNRHWPEILSLALLAAAILPPRLGAESQRGPYARISVLHPREGHTVDFEAGYVRHLAWHQQSKDTWVWYGWNVTFGERQRWFVYASFGHSAAALDSPVAPAEDERDNVLNVAPHVDRWENALFEFLPRVSRGTGVPPPTARLELTTVDLKPGGEAEFERALGAGRSEQEDEILWYRMVAGGTAPRYVRLRPRPSLSAILEGRGMRVLPEQTDPWIARTVVEILTLRPAMSFGLSPPARP